jgi:sulfate transport system permease protein
MNPDLHRIELIRNRRRIGKRVLLSLVLFWFFLLILIPLFGIVTETFSQGLDALKTSLSTPASQHAFWLTILLTLSSVILNTLFGTILAVVLARQNFKGKLALESLLDLPFAVSPVVAGFMLIILFGSKGWIGSWFSSMNIKIIYAFPGMLLATLFVTLPFVAREVLPVLREFGPEQEEAASTLGASQWQTFWRITLPTIKWGLAYGITLTIARSIGEFGAVLVVSGSIINKTQTATLRIHDQFADFNYAGAFSAALVLIIASFLLLNFIKSIYKTKGGTSS